MLIRDGEIHLLNWTYNFPPSIYRIFSFSEKWDICSQNQQTWNRNIWARCIAPLPYNFTRHFWVKTNSSEHLGRIWESTGFVDRACEYQVRLRYMELSSHSFEVCRDLRSRELLCVWDNIIIWLVWISGKKRSTSAPYNNNGPSFSKSWLSHNTNSLA